MDRRSEEITDEDINEIAEWLGSLSVHDLIYIKNLVLFYENWAAYSKKDELLH